MAEYVRFVSYLYEYQGNERKKNVGFVRYEVRAGQKRLMVSVNGVRCGDRRIPVYAFYRELDSCIGVALGMLVLKGGRGSFQYSTYADGPGEGEPECRFEEIAGVVVMGEADAPVFCTVWDNESFLVSGFVRCRQDLVRIRNIEEEKTAEAAEEQAQEARTALETADTKTIEKIIVTEECSEIEQPQEPENIEKAVPEAMASETASETAVETAGAETLEQCQEDTKKEQYALYRQSLWERLCKIYPKVRPFPYDCQIGALRIRPGDIGRLPKENWEIANNSFMLHGFFQHRYILLLRIPAQSPEYEERYMIAVPGTYSQMDQYLADMFGFHEFLGSPKQGCEDGFFGYFMQEVRME